MYGSIDDRFHIGLNKNCTQAIHENQTEMGQVVNGCNVLGLRVIIKLGVSVLSQKVSMLDKTKLMVTWKPAKSFSYIVGVGYN